MGYQEARLTDKIALRSELGFDTGFVVNTVSGTTNTLLAVLAITAEPRWYYNLNKRANKSKRIDDNSANFISIKTTYHPDWIFISDKNIPNFITDISIIPTWGIKRNLGDHFNYELGAGVGYQKYFTKDYVTLIESNVVGYNLHLRIGYHF